MTNTLLKVISASRRTDMIANSPEKLAYTLSHKAPPEKVHTVVLWTKNPENIFKNKTLKTVLEQYDQLFMHLTITGMGGSVLEPHVPKMIKVIDNLPAIIDFIKSPNRIRFRFDPIIHCIFSNGESFSNIKYFEELAQILHQNKIEHVSVSWVQLYDKVRHRLQKHGIHPVEIDKEQWSKEAHWLEKIANQNCLKLYGCNVKGWPASKCIDGQLLKTLHPKGYTCTTEKAGGQRELCGCTKSWDIGWYTGCKHSCLYCYGNPITS